MSARRILISGASGLLGGSLVETWHKQHTLCLLSGTKRLRGMTSKQIDLRDTDLLAEIVETFRPTHVVHAGALTDTDYCEQHPDEAMAVNAVASGELARLAKAVDARFVYVSTEAVFDGMRGNYDEDDAPAPVNKYGVSKLEGERAVLAAHDGALVVRVGLEGWRPVGRPGFVQWVVEGLRRKEPRTVFTDLAHTLAFAANMPIVLDGLWATGHCGLVHITTGERVTNMDIAVRAANVFDLDASLLTPITSQSMPLPTRRPIDVSLTSTRLPAAVKNRIWDLDEGLKEMREAERAGVVRRQRDRIPA